TPARKGIVAPPKRRHGVIIGSVRSAPRIEAEASCAVILIGAEPGMFLPDIGGPIITESGAPAHAPADLLHDPPIGAGLAGQWKEGALAADAAFRIGNGAVLLTPCRGGQADM